MTTDWVLTCPDPDLWRSRLRRRSRPDPSGCTLWTGAPSADGYGRFTFREDGRTRAITAHRAAWLALHGDLAPGETIDHLCRVKLCVEIGHLEAVPVAENNRRARPHRRKNIDWQALEADGDVYPACGHPRPAERRPCRRCVSARRRIASDRAQGIEPTDVPWFMRPDAAQLTTAEVLAQMGMGA